MHEGLNCAGLAIGCRTVYAEGRHYHDCGAEKDGPGFIQSVGLSHEVLNEEYRKDNHESHQGGVCCELEGRHFIDSCLS